MNSSSGVGSGVVERASKEISRRIHSLGFKTSSGSSSSSSSNSARNTNKEESSSSSSSAGGDSEAKSKSNKQIDVDKLNGNETNSGGNQASKAGGASSLPSSASTSTAPAPSAASKMGTIIKGSVMDKVTNVFTSSSSSSSSSSSAMGNVNNKEGGGTGGTTSSKSADTSPNGTNSPTSPPSSSATSPTGGGVATSPNGINIPKGAVANGRAKFEAANSKNTASPEKPMRFFGSRSRTNSPMLPVKTPKVPTLNPTNGKAVTDSSSSSNSTSSPSGGATGNTPLLNKKKNGNNATPPATNATAITSAENNTIISNSKLFPKMKRFVHWDEMWNDYKFLVNFFNYFTYQERFILAQVCKRWREVLYQPVFWRELRPVLHCRTLRTWTDNEPHRREMKQNYFLSLKLRGFESLVLLHSNDADVFDFIQNFPHGAKHIYSLTLRCCNLSDRGLEALMEFLQGLYQLEIAGCNEITEQGLWSSLHPRLVSVTINDCINVADECICAVTQLLPSLYEFNLQAYHVTDSALSYFSPKQTGTLNVLRLQSCWEITNHGIVNIVHTLPNLTVLSLSGCSKITDDGIELIAENLRKLRSLDVSWCPRVTDAALEYIACDLNHLEELTLDRCVHITDIGIGYISTMLALHTLFLRWCTQIRDFGLQHICGMRSMQVLSLAGCPLLTSSGLSNLIQLRHLVELELTNCPGATTELIDYLRQNLPNSLVLD